MHHISKIWRQLIFFGLFWFWLCVNITRASYFFQFSTLSSNKFAPYIQNLEICFAILVYFDFGYVWYSGGWLKIYGSDVPLTFLLFWPPSHRRNDTNDISFESRDIGLLQFKKETCCGIIQGEPLPNYLKSTTFTKISLKPLRT